MVGRTLDRIRRTAPISALGLVLLFTQACANLSGQPEFLTITRTQMHMGTLVTITAVAPTESAALAASTEGFLEIRRLEALLSTWISSSELSAVNAAAGKAAVHVSQDTLSVVKLALRVAEVTDGAFNIAIGPAVDLWNVTEKQSIPTTEELQLVRNQIALEAVHIDDAKQTIFLDRAGMRIDVGGIAKGYAADQAVLSMKKAGATAGIVALSGDIKAFGRLPEGKRFPIGIQHPRKRGEILLMLDLENEAISTAGDYERYFERDGVRYHHILDPSTLQPARECQSVSIIAKEGGWADGLDTGVFVLGPARGMHLIEKLGDVHAIIVDREGKVHVSSGLKQRIRFPAGEEKEKPR